MRDIVILSAWYRTRYLQTCFDALRNARGIENKELWVFQNTRQDADIAPASKMIENNLSRFQHTEWIRGSFASWMESHTIAWTDTYNMGAPKVYFFSDDVICTPDFLSGMTQRRLTAIGLVLLRGGIRKGRQKRLI